MVGVGIFSSSGATSVDAVGVMVGAGVSCGVGVLVGTFIALSSSIGAVGGMSGTIADDGVATAGGTVFLGLSTLSFHLAGVAMVCVGSFCRRG